MMLNRPDTTPDRFSGLRSVCSGEPSDISCGVRSYVKLPGLKVAAGNVVHVCDALLEPNHGHPTYPTKLFLERKLQPAPGKTALNWNIQIEVEDQTWYGWSWTGVPSNQPLISIISAHLEAFA